MLNLSPKKPKFGSALGAPGTHVINRPDLVHVQFQRRRARPLIKLIDRSGADTVRYYQGQHQHLQSGHTQISQGSLN